MILACQGICKSFGEKEILKDASFHIEDVYKRQRRKGVKPTELSGGPFASV